MVISLKGCKLFVIRYMQQDGASKSCQFLKKITDNPSEDDFTKDINDAYHCEGDGLDQADIIFKMNLYWKKYLPKYVFKCVIFMEGEEINYENYKEVPLTMIGVLLSTDQLSKK